jgi:hypothetical protein
MKKNTLIKLALLASIILSVASAKAANMDYTMNASRSVFLPSSSDSLNQNGRVWLGNFGNESTGSLLTLSQISLGGVNLFDSFRALTSFEIAGGRLAGDTGNGLSGSISVGNTQTDSDYVVSAGQFANQSAFILALSSTSSVWSDALAEWKSNGALNAILIKSSNGFSAASGDPIRDYSLSPRNGTLIFGTSTSSTITAAAAVPEPSVTTLLVMGVLGLGALRLRRQTV